MSARQQTTWRNGSLAVLLLGLLCALVAAPLGLLFSGALPDGASGAETLRGLLLEAPLQDAVLRTLAVALLACGLASLLAVPAAFVAVRANVAVRLLILAFGCLPLFMPPFITAAVLQHLAGALGQALPSGGLRMAGSSLGLTVAFALHFLPFILFSMLLGLMQIDRSLQESARNLGAGRLRIWRQISLPLATPAYVLGASLTIVRICEDVGAPLIVGVEGMLAPQILQRLGSDGLGDPLLNISALVLFGITLLVVALAWPALIPPLDARDDPRCGKPTRWGRGVGGLIIAAPLVLVLGVLALAPPLWLGLMSLAGDWTNGLLPAGLSAAAYAESAGPGLRPLLNTIVYGAAAGVLTLLIGGALGRLTTAPGGLARLMRFAATASIAVPGLLLALAYARTQEFLDLAPTHWYGSGALGLVLVVALKQLPIAQRLLAGPMRTLDGDGLEAARNLGAGLPGIYLRVALPAIRGALAAVFLIAMAATAMELSAALVLLRGAQAPLASSIFVALQTPGETALGAAQAAVLIAVIAATLLLALVLLRPRCPRSTSAPMRQARTVRVNP